MKVLIACEFSGVVREAFRKRGHDAWSCDLLPCNDDGPHIEGDVLKILDWNWDLMIAHPPCTYLCNSGVRWLYEKEGRWQKMQEASEFFKKLLDADIAKKCIENPVPHKHTGLPKYTQTIQPWEYGHGETKRTCLWLQGLPNLKPTKIVEGRTARIHRMAPSEDRGKLRSITYQGIAEAMADQWGA